MIKKMELLDRICEIEAQLMYLEDRLEKLEKPKKVRKVKNETTK
jgi:hypothetical protein